MSNTNEAQSILTRLDALAKQRGFARTRLAARLGIPKSTMKKWFAKTNPRIPSPENLRKLKNLLNLMESEDRAPKKFWGHVRDWWKTQHRYNSVPAFAEEIGWDSSQLRESLEKDIPPPQVVLEKIASLLSMPLGITPVKPELIQAKIERIKNLLLILEEELRWFRDGSQEAREVFRARLDPLDVGYISSLLVMLGEEEAFRRWLTLTTNRFNSFKKKGDKDGPQSPH